jgi:hypothetical protein
MAKKRIALIAGAAVAAILVRRRVAASRSKTAVSDAGRWRVVTVFRDDVAEQPLPRPLAELGDLVEIRITVAPGGKGSELAARLRYGEPDGMSAQVRRAAGTDPRQAVRRALRESKQLLETGEVVRLDPKPEGRRKHTPGGALTDLVADRSLGEGVL